VHESGGALRCVPGDRGAAFEFDLPLQEQETCLME
jgi:hypothetical protein